MNKSLFYRSILQIYIYYLILLIIVKFLICLYKNRGGQKYLLSINKNTMVLSDMIFAYYGVKKRKRKNTEILDIVKF